MTICVAVNTAKHGQPPYGQVAFEEGILMAADSRITYVGDAQPPEDDICKVDFLSDYAMAGYAGNVAVARRALPELDDEYRKQPRSSPEQLIQLTIEILQDHYARVPSRQRVPLQVLVGMRDFARGTYRLYYLQSGSLFVPQERTGLYAIGSGGAEFAEAYQCIFTKGKDLAQNPFRHPSMPMWGGNSMANLIGQMLDLQLKDAWEKHGSKAKIGGSVRMASLSDHGIEEAVGHQIFDNGIPKLTLYPPLRG